jgi:UDP-glucose 4-epimerase
MRVLVTGGAGFIGSHLVDMLLGFGYDVVVLDDYSTGSRVNLTGMMVDRPGRQMWRLDGSVARPVDVERAMALGPDVVFHLAAQVDVRRSAEAPRDDAMVNVMGTITMLQAAETAGVRRFVFVSSAAIFGDQNVEDANYRGRVHELQPSPISPYGAAKAAAELYVELYDRRGGMSCSTVVLSNVYGPRQRPGTGAVNIFARALLAGEPVTLYGDGGNVRDYVWVGDAVRALAWAGRCLRPDDARPVPAARILVGTGIGTTDEELLALVGNEVANQGGGAARLLHAPARPVDIRRMLFPASDGMTPTTLADGLALTVQAIRKELAR